MADILTKLPAFLLEQARKPFSFETNTDCLMLLADWVWYAQGGEDPAKAIRGSYSDEAGANAIIEDAGGAVAYVDMLAAAARCRVVQNPQDGDFGVLDMPGGLTGGIMSNGSWAFRTRKGMAWSRVTPGRIVKVWCLDA